MVYDDGSVTEAFAVEFVKGDFNVKLARAGDGWTLSAASEANATGRRMWWLWLIAGLVVALPAWSPYSYPVTPGGWPPEGSW